MNPDTRSLNTGLTKEGYMLLDKLYDDMMEYDEFWFICGPGTAYLILDLPLYDL